MTSNSSKKVISFDPQGTLADFQKTNQAIYGVPDDRQFSVRDLVSNQERFTMRALKGIRKGDKEKLTKNLLIALSWMMAVANRLHIDVEKVVWRRFPGVCSYCGKRPCECKIKHPEHRMTIAPKDSAKPAILHDFQNLFNEIYPAAGRTLAEAGVHMAEEMGEVNEAILIYSGEHKDKQFREIESEIADFVSCAFGVANSADIDIAAELATLYSHNCHACHEAPCTCNFSFVAKFTS